MNVPVVVAGVLTLLAFPVHTFVGGSEFRWLAPKDDSPRAGTVRAQTIAGWHWVSVDLLLAGLLLLWIGLSRPLVEDMLLLGLSGYFAVLGATWLGVAVWSARGRPARVLELGQWILCLVLAALAWAGR